MGNGIISFLMAAGAGAWIFSKFQRSTGGGDNTKTSLIAAAVSALLIFIFMYLLLGTIIKK